MAKSKKQKEEAVKEYREKIKSAKALYFVDPENITPNEVTELKKRLFEIDSMFNVIKNSLFKIALEEEGLEVPEDITKDKNAVVFTSEAISEAAKALKEFIKETEKMVIRNGFLDGGALSKSQIEALAELPSKEELLAQVVATMNAPVSGFVNVLAGNVRNIVQVINAIKEQKGE